MRIKIYSVYYDDPTINNYLRLVRDRQGVYANVQFSPVTFNPQDRTLTSKKNIFGDTNIAERNNIQVEFVAHGNPGNYNEIFVAEKPSKDGHEGFTPQELNQFFKSNASENGQYKFDKITLFCCESKNFGEALSKEMRDIRVTCFEKPIYVDTNGIAYAQRTKEQKEQKLPTGVAVYYTYLNSNLVETYTPNDARSPAQIAASAQTLSVSNMAFSQTKGLSLPQKSLELGAKRAMTVGKKEPSWLSSIAKLATALFKGDASKLDDKTSVSNPSVDNNRSRPIIRTIIPNDPYVPPTNVNNDEPSAVQGKNTNDVESGYQSPRPDRH